MFLSLKSTFKRLFIGLLGSAVVRVARIAIAVEKMVKNRIMDLYMKGYPCQSCVSADGPEHRAGTNFRGSQIQEHGAYHKRMTGMIDSN